MRLDNRAAARRGGDSGPAVKPGDVDESLLISAIRYESFEMPPAGKLPKNVVEDFVRWVEMGAPDPRDGEVRETPTGLDIQQGRKFWSFQPLTKPPVPLTAESSWPRNEIDRFVFSRLQSHNLRPAEDADRRALLRRVYFDLIGLPPTPEQIEAFLADTSPRALETVVDRLLASRHFGERWGRHWLDVARYADSSGGGRTLVFHDAWRYRDYVIDAFNADLPFRQFVMEQIAGDLLPHDSPAQRARQLTATGFLVLGPTNYELQDKELLRMEVVDEQIDTTGRAFLGMTIGCARCHDHKFDPIPNSDYYALAGIFRSTKTLTPGNVSGFVQRELPVDGEHLQALQEHQARVAPLEKKIEVAKADLKKLERALGVKTNSVDPASLDGIVLDDDDAALSGDWKTSSSVKPFVGTGYRYAGRGAARAVFAAELKVAGQYEVRVSHTPSGNRASNARVEVRHADGVAESVKNHRTRPNVDGLFESLGKFRFAADKPAEVVFSCEEADGFVVIDGVQFIPLKPQTTTAAGEKIVGLDESDKDKNGQLRDEMATVRASLKKLESQLATANKSAPPPPPVCMGVRDEDETGDYFICIRGNVHNLGAKTPRGFLSVAALDDQINIPTGASGRLELARWIASPENTLTSRVICNRVWHWLLGEGLVRTPDNFGVTGDRPSHPELIDYLAARFVEEGWSIKRLIKLIVLSRTYGLSSTASAAAVKTDPRNELLSHAHRRRLDAESIRDAILFASGELDAAQGGRTVPVSVKSEFGFEFTAARRSMYMPVFRNSLPALLHVFDFPDPNLVGGRRNTSTLPTQSLFLMNSPFLIEQSQRAARRLLAEADVDDDRRLEAAYLRMLGRAPLAAEREIVRQYLQSRAPPGASQEEREKAWAGLCQALFGCLDFRYLE